MLRVFEVMKLKCERHTPTTLSLEFRASLLPHKSVQR